MHHRRVNGFERSKNTRRHSSEAHIFKRSSVPFLDRAAREDALAGLSSVVAGVVANIVAAVIVAVMLRASTPRPN